MTVRNDLDSMFEQAAAEGRTVLVPYLTAGFPRVPEYVDLAVAVLEAGADLLEIGVPFSDPLLDGPVIQRSQQIALDSGVTPLDCLRFAREIRSRTKAALLFFGAFNPIAAFGVERFCREAEEAGVSALLIPDLPLEEQQGLRNAADQCSIHLIQLVAPTTSDERLGKVCAAASGFVYCISVAGVTGTRAHVADLARPLVERIRTCTNVPVVVGFGIASPKEARQVGEYADGVAIGSELINRVGAAAEGQSARVGAGFVRSLREAL